MNTVESLAVIGASVVGIIAGIAAFTKFITRRFISAVTEVVADQVTEIKRQLAVEFSGNGGGAREAINELHVKVDAGFEAAAEERTVLTKGQTEINDRIDKLERPHP